MTLAALLMACATPDAAVDTALEVEEEVETVVPADGWWSIESRTVLLDECGGILGDDDEGSGDTFELHSEADDPVFTFVIAFDDGERFEIDCEAEGTSFVCEGAMDVYTIGDTTLSATWSGGGELADEHALSATLDATAHCDGSLCTTAEEWLQTSLPCDGSMGLEASWLEEG